MANKIVDLTLVADYTPAPDPPEANAELSLDAVTYVVNENDTVQVTINRTIRTDQVIDVDWAAINVSVLPASGTVRFGLGEATKIITLTAQEVNSNEEGTFELSNPQYVSGPVSDPILVAPSTASFFVNDTYVPPDERTGIIYWFDGVYGYVNSQGTADNGMRIEDTLRFPQPTDQCEKSGSGGFDEDTNCNTRVVPNGYRPPNTPLGAAAPINARRPATGHFITSVIYADNYYNCMNESEDKDKPRSNIVPLHDGDDTTSIVHPGDVPNPDYFKTSWFGISFYIPENIELDTLAAANNDSTRWELISTVLQGASETIYEFGFHNEDELGDWEWYVQYSINPNSCEENMQPRVGLARMDLDQDKGKWTDWIFRTRVDPFTTPTRGSDADPVQGKNIVLPGNSGIFQMWKTYGPVHGNGHRDFKKITALDIENAPFGNVPRKDYNMAYHPRIYRGNWDPLAIRRQYNGVPSNQQGPVMIGFDEFYWGVEENGATFADVNPGQLPMP